MDVGLVLRVAGVGMLVSVACQILAKSGRDEQAMLVTVAGIISPGIIEVKKQERDFS